jgi:hypothetical protein
MPFGTASITFTTATTANITVNGYSFPVTRQLFGFDFTSAAQPLLGELSMVEGTFGMYFGDRIVFTRTMVSSDGTLFAAGNKTGDTTRIAVGSYVPGLQKWTVLLDTSTSYYDYYTFVFDGLNLIEGDDYTYLKTSMPSGSLPMVGFRTKSAQAAAGSNAPGTIRAQMAESNANVSNDYSVAKTTIQAAKVLEPSEFETLRVLEMMLESIRQQR